MRTKTLWLSFAVTAALLLAGSADAQRAGKKDAAGGACAKEAVGTQGTCEKADVSTDDTGKVGDRGGKRAGFKGGKDFVQGGKGFGKGKGKGFGKGGRGGFGQGLTAEEIVERLMAFDKNKDGKVTKDELPERMQDLIAKGDTNKDGALDKAEIEKLANTLAQDRFAGGFGGFGGRGGFGPKGGFGGFGPKGGRGGPQAALADLNLSDKTKEKAEAVVKAHQETVRKLMDMAHSDLLVKMKDVLSEKEFKTFKEALDRRPPFAGLVGTTSPRSADLEKRIDQLQKSLDDLRKAIKP
jgi:hypothetical protein